MVNRCLLAMLGALLLGPSPAARMREVRKRIAPADIAWIREATRKQLRGCRVRGAGGVWLHTPDGVGNYRALWTRDFEYMVEFAGDLLEPSEIKASIRYLLAGQRSDGCMPDRVNVAGKGICSPGGEQSPLADHALDNGAFMAKLVAAYVDLTGDLELFREVEPRLRKGLDHTRRASNGLVFNPKDSPQCPYGFTDTVAKTGHILFCSLLYFDACVQMERICRRAGCGEPATYGERSRLIREHISLLWDEGAGMFLAADGDCRQLDIWGSAFAVHIGCATDGQADRVAAYLAGHYGEITQRGQVRHLPAGETWQRMFAPVKPGTYQNGAFWGTPLAWIVPVIARRDIDLAVRMVREAIADYRAHGITECVNGPYHNVPQYVASAASVYALLREPPAPHPGAEGARPFVLNPDGAWCWFQDERAVMHGGRLTAASITRGGDVQVSTWNPREGGVTVTTLHRHFGADDHDTAALLVRRDGRLMAFYARHHREPRMFYRVTAQPDDTRTWGPEQSYGAGAAANFTYANPFQLSAENGRIYNFWRGVDYNPTWSASDDGGRTWSPAANHIYFRKGERPYVKYASDGRGTIHFAFTEAHPNRPIATSLYHAVYKGGLLLTSTGKVIRELSDGPIHPSEATRVHDGRSPQGEVWVWDLALDVLGRPIVAYSLHRGPQDIRYAYAAFNGAAWEDHEIARGGTRLYKGEEHYAGGICLDPDRPRVVYLSSNVDIRDGSPRGSGRYELYRGVTKDRGKTWAWRPLTSESREDNLRPIVPAGHPGRTFVLWLRGSYRSYTNYATSVMVLVDTPMFQKEKQP